MSDYSDEEKTRKTSIYSKPFSGQCKTSSGRPLGLVFTDTPGYMDFFGQVIAACSAVETAVTVVNAAAGVQVGTRRAWRTASAHNLAKAIVVTGLDRENTDFAKTLADIQSNFGDCCMPVTIPSGDLKSVINVLSPAGIPDDMADAARDHRNRLLETAASTDDALIEKFLVEEPLTPEEISSGLKKAVISGALVPVFVCMAAKDIGVSELIDGMEMLLPSPADAEKKDSGGNVISSAPDAPFVGFVWRTVNDAFVGQLVFVRVLGGTLRADSEIENAEKGQKEKIGSLLVLNGKKQANVDSAVAGEIVAIPKLKATGINETLRSHGSSFVCARIKYPNPVTFMAVYAKTQADEDKIGVALARVADEDPTLKVERNTETKETIISGLGDVHIDVAVDKMRTRSHVDVVLSTPKVAYRETVTGKGEGHYKHKKQSGGRGQYAEVYLRVCPLPQGDEEWFEDAIVGGVIPGNFVPAVQKGVVEGMAAGALAGYTVTNVKITVYDGSYHDVDSSEIAFKIASSRAFRDAMSNAKPVLLEPIMNIKVAIPDQYMGDINGDLNHKRGRILGIGSEEGMQIVTAEVPQAELFRYAAELRSITGGQGSFDLEFARYDIVPSNVAQKIIAAAEKDRENED